MRPPSRLSGARRHSSTVRGTCSEPGMIPAPPRSASERMSTTSAPALAARVRLLGAQPLDPRPRALERSSSGRLAQRSPRGTPARSRPACQVLLAPLGDELGASARGTMLGCRVVADDGQARAGVPAVGVRSRSRRRRRAPALGAASRGSSAGSSAGTRKWSSARSCQRPKRPSEPLPPNVAAGPRDLRGAGAEPAPRGLERRLRDVEHGHVGEALWSSRRPARGDAPPPTLDDRLVGIHAERVDQLQ